MSDITLLLNQPFNEASLILLEQAIADLYGQNNETVITYTENVRQQCTQCIQGGTQFVANSRQSIRPF